MKRKRIAVYGVSEESLPLLPHLLTNPDLEVIGIYAPEVGQAQALLRSLTPAIEAAALELLTSDERLFEAATGLHAVVDSRVAPALTHHLPELFDEGVEILSPLLARLLWGFRDPHTDHKHELIHTLQEVVESYDLTIGTDELFERMLQIAIGATGADQGSLMLLDPATNLLRVRMAVGIERELWPKIQVRMGEGIAGKVAAEASPLLLRGHADHMAFHVVHDRNNVVSAISVPLLHEGKVLGVLNLHHRTQPDIFSHSDLDFVEQLASLDAALIAKAQEFDRLRSLSARYDAAHAVRDIFRGEGSRHKQLQALCQYTARQVGSGIVSVYLHNPDRDRFTLAATSLTEEAGGPALELAAGTGLDGQVAESGEPILLRWADASLAYAALPIVSGELQVGVLTAQIAERSNDAHLLEGTLKEITLAAGDEIAQLERKEQVEGQLKRMRAVGELGLRLLSARSDAEVVQIITGALPVILGAEFVITRLRDPESGRFFIRGCAGPRGENIQTELIHLDKLTSREAAMAGSILAIRDIPSDPRFSGLAPSIHSGLAIPLRSEARVIGTIATYNKLTEDRFCPGPFASEDGVLLEQIAAYVERALSHEIEGEVIAETPSAPVAQGEGTVEDDVLYRRISEEIVRAAGRPDRVVLLRCELENFDAIREKSDAAHAKFIVRRIGETLRSHLRIFDVLAQTGPNQFTALLPDPGESPEQRLSALARTVTHEVTQLEELNAPLALRLSFGYALHPRDGRSRASLLERASTPRIRVV